MSLLRNNEYPDRDKELRRFAKNFPQMVRDMAIDGEPTNYDRGQFAYVAVLAFQLAVHGDDDLQQNVGDLLADLAHLLDSEGYEVKDAFKSALEVYEEEVDEEHERFPDDEES